MSGDHIWIPCEMLETDNDISLFNDGFNGYRDHLLEKNRPKESHDLAPFDGNLEEKTTAAASSALQERHRSQAPAEGLGNVTPEVPAAEDDVAMIGATNEAHDDKVPDIITTAPAQSSDTKEAVGSAIIEDGESGGTLESTEEALEGERQLAEEDSEIKIDDGSEAPHPDGNGGGSTQVPEPDDDEATQDQEDIPEPRRMRTRAQAQAASDNTTISRPRSTTPSMNSSYIHPYFLAPPSARPTPDIGLPPVEAQETRRLLQLYVQKQEEICRGSQKIYDGLMRAERLRKTALKWAKADGHLGEMSDGEDWYDKEEWGLSEDLKKGQDEEEEDAATTAKKTRTRRQ